MVGTAKKSATLADYLSIPECERDHEILDGELVQRAQPTQRHGYSQLRFGAVLDPYQRKSGGPPDRPGGWWILSEPDLVLGESLVRPDVAGWRRERVPVLSDEPVMRVICDWICEVVSPSSARRDRGPKKRLYHRHQIPHYWLLDPSTRTLSVNRWSPEGYVEILSAETGDLIRPEPFDGTEFALADLFDDD
jgi:Uma2 family endonuclease